MNLQLPVTAFIGIALGFGLGVWWEGSKPPAAAAETGAPSPARPAAARAATTHQAAAGEDIDALKRELEACKLSSRLRQAQQEGVLQEMPEGWAPAFRSAEAVRAGAERAIEACGLPLEVAQVDCAEPPCMVWMERSDGSDFTRDFLKGCPEWTEVYESKRTSQGQLITDEGAERRYWMVSAEPPGWPPPEDADNINLRLGERHKEGRAALMEEWGAHEPPDLPPLPQRSRPGADSRRQRNVSPPPLLRAARLRSHRFWLSSRRRVSRSVR